MSQFLSYLLILSFFFFFDSLGTNSSPLCQPYNCSNVTIHYPFWVRNESASDQPYCGYKGFGVMCLNGTAELELHGDRYHVKDINYADYTLSLVDIDVSNQTCPRARHNVSLETLPLKYSSMDLNLSFYFNCTSDPAITVPPIPCLNINGSYRHSYVFVENHETEGYDWSKNCKEKVVVTVRHLQTEINIEDLIDRFGGAMNDGFVLDWERVMDCVACENSEGYCGYNATAEEFLCFCNDGSTHRNSCKALSSLITLFFFLTILPPSYCNAVEYFDECIRPFNCGRIRNIPYPFWGGNRSELCGLPGFKLTCRDNEYPYPIIRFKELDFLVLNIDQSHHTMTIARFDPWNSPCPPKLVNTTLDFNNFDYTPTDQNLTLFYDCPSGVSGLEGASFPCGLGGVGANYFVDESFPGIHELLEECNTNIKVPILRTALIDESVGGALALQNVLKQGFDVDYHNASSNTCWGCVASGGICSPLPSPHPFVCFCRDGEQPLVCPSNEFPICLGISSKFLGQTAYDEIILSSLITQ
ncbi:leaf rust 10 disease-resistance locus receptor-like protein kinase-like 2.7 [Quercus suber]|uniref:non-specific serine/threonine protein kinase n=1 Tax=Quercus suber TaxID=58331 RepID=A0AAW0KZP4_QUESU